MQGNGIRKITSSMLGDAVNQDVRHGEIILRLLYDLGGFFNSGAGSDHVKNGMKYAEFNKDGKGYDEFLKFDKIEEKLEDFFISRSNYNYSRGTSKWLKVDRQLTKAHQKLSSAQTEEEFQGVGLICCEILITAAQEVYDEEVHASTNTKDISQTDAKRMLDAYIITELPGKQMNLTESLLNL